MRRLAALLIGLASALLSGCGGGDTELGPEGAFRALHAVPDLDQAAFFVLGSRDLNRGTLDFSVAANRLTVGVDTYEFWFEVVPPGASESERVVEFSQAIAADTDYTFVLTGTAETPALLTWERPRRSVSGARYLGAFGHAAQSLGPVDVYVEVPGTDPAGAIPRAQIDFGDFAADIEIPAGESQLIITERDLPGSVLFSSATFTAAESASLLFAILDGAQTGSAPLLVRVLDSPEVSLLEDLNSPPELRVAHAAAGTDPVDVVVAGVFDPAFISNLAFPALADYAPTVAGETELTIIPTGNPGTLLAEETLNLRFGERASLFFLGPPESLEVVAFPDDNRRLSQFAQLRVVQSDSTYSFVDVYLVEQGEDFTAFRPLFGALAFRASTGPLQLIPDAYEFVITPAGDDQTILAGPINLDLEAGGLYGYYLVTSPDPDRVELRPLDDLVP